MVKVEQINKHVTRAVLRVPDRHPGTGEISTHEILFTVRPGWSKIGSYLPALPGGKIETMDFSSFMDPETFDDPHFIITFDQMISAGIKAIEREILEELRLPLATNLLHFINSSTNKEGWTTFAYAANLADKPSVFVQPDSAGSLWISEKRILTGNPRMFNGHLNITRAALKKLSTNQ